MVVVEGATGSDVVVAAILLNLNVGYLRGGEVESVVVDREMNEGEGDDLNQN